MISKFGNHFIDRLFSPGKFERPTEIASYSLIIFSCLDFIKSTQMRVDLIKSKRQNQSQAFGLFYLWA